MLRPRLALKLMLFVVLEILVPACVHDDGSSMSLGRPITLTSSTRLLNIPAEGQVPSVGGLTTSIVSRSSLMSGVSPALQAMTQNKLAGASASCLVEGCAWHQNNIEVLLAADGLFAGALGATSASIAGAAMRPRLADSDWAPTYTLIADANQTAQSLKLSSNITSFAPAFAVPALAIQRLAMVLGLDGETLLARGVTIGMVWTDAAHDATTLPGVAQARIVLPTALPNMPTLVYLNDMYSGMVSTGTNRDGAFVLVGAAVQAGATQASPLEFAVDVTSAPSHAWRNCIVNVSPGSVIVVPLRPTSS